MFINTIFVTAALAASAVVAAPAEHSTKRQNEDERHVKLCRDPEFHGCVEFPYTPYSCATLWENVPDIPVDINDKTTSFDTYDVECYFYVDTQCELRSGVFYSKGQQRDLGDSGMNYANDAISSFECRP